MKNKLKYLLSLILILGIINQIFAQAICIQPPVCIQNGSLTSAPPGATGNMNAGANIPNWFVSHGTPSCGAGAIWMWSRIGQGEGIFTCYNFQAGKTYCVSLDIQYNGSGGQPGNLMIDATTGLVAGGPGSIFPIPTTNQNIYNLPQINPILSNLTVTFTAAANFSQLWVRPFDAGGTVISQYAIIVDNIHVEDMSIVPFTPLITTSGPILDGVPVTLTATGGPAGTVYSWSTSLVVGNSITVTPNCNTTQTFSVTGSYNNCPLPNAPSAACTRNSNVASINILATDCCKPDSLGNFRRLIIGNNCKECAPECATFEKGIIIDNEDKNNGTIANSLKFGVCYTGEAIGSKRNALGNQFGLDFYTNYLNRMAITNSGQVGIATTAPTALLHVSDVNGAAPGGTTVRFQDLAQNLQPPRMIVSDVNGNLGWANMPTLSGGVTSSCTAANFIPKVATAGSSNLICSQIFDNGTSVGIGTTTPNLFAKLHTLNTASTPTNYSILNQSITTSAAVSIGVGSYNMATNLFSTNYVGYGSYNIANSRAVSIGTLGQAQGSNLTTSKIGIMGIANANSCIGNNVGVYGQVTSTVGFCGTHFAGYFAGLTLSGGPALVISDSTLKTNVRNITDAMTIINALQPRTYDFDPTVNSGFALTNKHQYGFISQEVERVIPDVVQDIQGPIQIDAEGVVTENNTTYKAMNYDALVSVLVKGMQEQQHEIEELKSMILLCCESRAVSKMNGTEEIKVMDIKISDKNTIVLNQNVPNPFAESTSISYFIPEIFTKAQLIFTNVQGQVIKSLDIKEMGKGQINVFADDLTSGQYTYTLVVDGKTIQTKKMIKE